MSNQNSLFQSVRTLIENSRGTIVRNINTMMLYTYFKIGQMIVEEEQRGSQRAGYGEKLVRELSSALTHEYGSGYSKRNLDYFKQFYLNYRDRIVQTLFAQSNIISSTNQVADDMKSIHTYAEAFSVSWSHYLQLMKISDIAERSFYEVECKNNNWSLRELQRQYQSSLYQRLALSRNKEEVKQLSDKGQILERPIDALKTPIVLEFLSLKEDSRYSENDLETAIINKLEAFMMELGKGFLFEGRQRRITLEQDHFWIDLVFYNRLLNCFVLIDLKIGKLTHQDIGQMQMYVNYYDRKIKKDNEQPTIGIGSRRDGKGA